MSIAQATNQVTAPGVDILSPEWKPTYLEELQQEYSDMHKDVYGMRPRGYSVNMDSIEWLEDAIRGLCDSLNRQLKWEQEHREECIRNFEKLVDRTIGYGAKNRKTALRWIMSGTDYKGDWCRYAVANGLPINYFKKG